MINMIIIFIAFISVITLSMMTLGIWLWAIFDIVAGKKQASEKILWLLVVFFFNFIGALVYLIAARDKEREPLKRSGNKVFFGVCAGIAERFSINPTAVRIVWILFTFMTGGFGLFYYLALSSIIPSDKGRRTYIPMFILFLLILGMFLVVLAGSNYYENNDEIYYEISYRDDQVSRQVVHEIMGGPEDMVIDRIKSSYNYYGHNGYGLRLEEMMHDKDCDGGECYRYRYVFLVDSDELPEEVQGFEVIAKVSGNNIQHITFSEITQSVNNNAIREIQ